MGNIKFKGMVVYEGPLAKAQTSDGWCDSMATYYPTLSVWYVVNGEQILCTRVNVDQFVDPSENKYFEYSIDTAQESDMNRIIKKRKDDEEADVIRLHKKVIVYKGRKVKIGTEGEVFWMGDSGYGMSVGLRLLDGTKVFTSMKNVKTVKLNEIFEDLILKS